MENGKTMSNSRTVGILVFDEVEVLDFAGPFEVLSVAGRRDGLELFDVFLVAEKAGPVFARSGFSVNPRYTFEDSPPTDIVVVPGGYGTRREMHNPRVVEWIARVAPEAELVLSVCTGALLLAVAGCLDGLSATTHHGAFDLLEETAPRVRVERAKRLVDNGRFVLSAGISAGLDMALYVVARLHGAEVARETARYMEYDWDQQRVTPRL